MKEISIGKSGEKSIDVNNIVIDAEDVTLNLNNNKIVASGSNGAVKVTGGKVTLDGAGEVKATLGSDNYSMAVWAENGKVVIRCHHSQSS